MESNLNKSALEAVEQEKRRLEKQVEQYQQATVRAEDEARAERLRWEEDFRKRALAMLNSLIEQVDGRPKETLEKLEKLIEKLDEVLKIKEDLTPRWVKILLASTGAFLLALASALFTAWWHLSSLSKHLPILMEYLQRHEDIIKLLDAMNRTFPKP